MSAIDQYKHKLLGFIECPATFNFVYNNPTRKIAIYELLQDVPNDEDCFDGKAGDIILGSGSGGAPALRISIPKATLFFTVEGWDDFKTSEDLFKAFWTPTASYVFAEGFSKIGWSPNQKIEFWLVENICFVLVAELKQYSSFKTSLVPKSVLSFSPAEFNDQI